MKFIVKAPTVQKPVTLISKENSSEKSSKQLSDKIPLPSLFGDGIVYVTAQRYKRILKRRQARLKNPV